MNEVNKNMLRNYIYIPHCGSTNTFLKQTVRAAAGPVFSVLSAESQSGGRGRRGKSFFSPAGGLYFSAAYPLPEDTANAPFFTLLAGLAAAETLEALTGARILLKWPNDLYLNGKKLGGILTELVRTPACSTAVVGFGVNTALPLSAFPQELRGILTSFAAEGYPVPERKTAVRAVVNALDAYIYTERALSRDTAPYAEKINARFYLKNRNVKIKNGESETRGAALCLAKNGALLLQTENGITQILSGTVINDE